MTMAKTRYNDQPWLAIFEFQSYSDAAAFKTLVQEAFGDEPLLRRKIGYFKQEVFASWRTTSILRNALANRTFDAEMVSKVLEQHNYSGTISSTRAWLGKAIDAKVIERMARGEYKFLQPEELDA